VKQDSVSGSMQSGACSNSSRNFLEGFLALANSDQRVMVVGDPVNLERGERENLSNAMFTSRPCCPSLPSLKGGHSLFHPVLEQGSASGENPSQGMLSSRTRAARPALPLLQSYPKAPVVLNDLGLVFIGSHPKANSEARPGR
jgi:hypothetical protein